ncbi:MAG: hypothetical protein ACFFEA_07525 [Candidatus Thorarchaeota archaeon]
METPSRLKLLVQGAYVLVAVIVVLLTFLAPFAEASWVSMTPIDSGHRWLFVWGEYDPGSWNQTPAAYDSRFIGHVDVGFLAFFWILCGGCLAFSILYSAGNTRHRVSAMISVLTIFLLQIIVPLYLFVPPIDIIWITPITATAVYPPIPSSTALIALPILWLVDEMKGDGVSDKML